MEYHKGIKFRLYPNKEQQNKIARTFGCCRLMYNKGLDLRVSVESHGLARGYVKNYSAIGGGIAQAFLHLSIDYKVVGQKFKLVDEYFDKTLDYINKDSKELASAMIDYISSLKSSYYTNKYPYDMAAIYLFFERGRKQKLVCHINGENRIL